jgi:hypothetical protein
MAEKPQIENNKEMVPFRHYQALLATLDPLEIALRTNVPFEKETGAFKLTLMGDAFCVHHPEGTLTTLEGAPLADFSAGMLLLRYLCEGGYAKATGRQLTYHDVPWGEVYYRNFDGRCLKRLAYGFGQNFPAFTAAMERLGAEKLAMGDIAYRFEFLDNLFMTFILWRPDDEFGPSAQILFDDNFPAAFTAEDLAVVGEVSIRKMKALSSQG